MPPQISRRPKRAKKRAAARKIVEPKRRQSISLGEKLVLEAITWGEPLFKRLESLVRVIEEQFREILCSILLLDEDGKTLRYGAAPSLPESYNRAIDGLAIGPSVGSCGTAAYRKEIVVVRDIATDPLWANCRHLALSHGLRACWSVPIVSPDEKVLGTFAMYYRKPRSPNAKELELIQFAAHVAGIAIPNSRADEAAMANIQAVISAEAKFRGLVETSPDAIVSVDREGRMVFVNSQTEKMFGYSRDELLGKAVEMLVPERFRDRHIGHRTDYTSNPRTRLMGVWFDIRGRRKDGSDIPVDIALSPVETDGGLLVTAIIRDISERKRAEEELQARYEELYALHEIGEIVLNSLDLQTTVEGILDKAIALGPFDIGTIRLFDLSNRVLKPVALRGYQDPNNVIEITVELENSRIGLVLAEVLRSKEAYVVDNVPLGRGLQAFKKEGVQSAIVVPVRAQEQVLGTIQLGSRTPRKFEPHKIRILETLGSQLGIAVQKNRLYEEAQRNLERIHALHEMDLAITATLDLRTVLDILLDEIGRLFSFVTATTVRLLNRETGELEPVACRNLDEEEWKVATAGATARGLGRMLPEKNTPVMVLNVQTDPRSLAPEFLRKYGLVSSLRVPLVVKEEVLGALTFFTKEEHQFTDEEVGFLTTLAGQAAVAIHNSQLYEEMAKLAGDLAKSNRVKDEFLSVMSHELRTPLNVVMGYAGMIKDGLLGEINQQQKEGLEKIINRSNDQLFMINNILYATVLETEEVKIEAHEISLVDFLNQLRLGREAPTHKELTLHWDYPPDLPVIKTNSAKLKQILQNLIDNALKFTDKGSVTVSARMIESSRQKAERSREEAEILPAAHRLLPTSGQWMEFKVADTGIGIPKEAIPIILEKFRQLDSSETRLYGGVGLGLYIVKKLTELLGGKVEVESEVGKGSTFTVTLPLN